MRLIQQKQMHGPGWHIICVTDEEDSYSSWWSSPPKNLYHADDKYLTTRYPCLDTPEKIKEFKKLYEELPFRSDEIDFDKMTKLGCAVNALMNSDQKFRLTDITEHDLDTVDDIINYAKERRLI